jgi:hypothetical protein
MWAFYMICIVLPKANNYTSGENSPNPHTAKE